MPLSYRQPTPLCNESKTLLPGHSYIGHLSLGPCQSFLYTHMPHPSRCFLCNSRTARPQNSDYLFLFTCVVTSNKSDRLYHIVSAPSCIDNIIILLLLNILSLLDWTKIIFRIYFSCYHIVSLYFILIANWFDMSLFLCI